MDNEVEVPRYFICPISLQIMKDPVTTETGITYDRDSIERWLFLGDGGGGTTCPVSKHPLSKQSDLIPNHTLRRLIQAWCVSNAGNGVDLIPTPKVQPDNTDFLKLLQDLWRAPQLHPEPLKTLAALAAESERNRGCMEEAGVAKEMVRLIMACHKKEQIDVVEEALSVLYLAQPPLETMKLLVLEHYDVIVSLTWVLQLGSDEYSKAKTHVVLILKPIIETAPSHFLGRLHEEFFRGLVQVVREGVSMQVTKAALRILLEACPCGRNRMKMIEAGAVFHLIEFQLSTMERRSNELVLCVLDHLCACADGRAELLGHSAGLALVSKRIMRISPTADDLAVLILLSVCKFSATSEVLREMLRVGAVSKLCMLVQGECGKIMKQKVIGVLKLHSKAWKNSPCISVDLQTRYP